MSLDSAATELLALLATLPASSNPYLAIQDFLASSLTPATPASFNIQLYVLMGLHGM